jgi:photosystem II stability/assembly factor-like uncharacterized protein
MIAARDFWEPRIFLSMDRFKAAMNDAIGNALRQLPGVRHTSASLVFILWGVFIAWCDSAVSLAKETVPSSWYDPVVAAQRSDAQLHALFPLSSERIWGVGDRGLILASEDGGISWKVQESGVTCPLRDICFIDRMRGWAVGYIVQPFSQRAMGIVLVTTDGGKKWNPISQPWLPPMQGIRATEAGNLIAWGGWSSQMSSSVFESLDGGRTWAPSPHLQQEFRSIFPLAAGWLGLQGDGAAVQWELSRVQSIRSKDLWSHIDCDGIQVLGVKQDNRLYRGHLADTQSWHEIGRPSFLDEVRVIVGRANTMVAAGVPSSLIARSEDGGTTWQATESPNKTAVRQFIFLDELRGWGLGDLGSIIATRDGGKTWWVQRSGASQIGVMFVVRQDESIPWTTIAYSAAELQRTTALVLVGKNETDTMSSTNRRRRVEAAASAVGVNQVCFLEDRPVQSVGTQVNGTDDFRRNNDPYHITALIDHYRPEMIVVGEGVVGDKESLKEIVLRKVLKREKTAIPIEAISGSYAEQKNVHKVYTFGMSRARSIELNGSQVLKRSGMLLGDIAQRAATITNEKVDINLREPLLMVYSDNPSEGSTADLAAGFIPSQEATRQIDLGQQGNLQVVLGSAVRRKSLERLVDTSRRESRDDSWDDYFRQVVESLTRDELEVSLVWLADRLREQGKWMQWQLVAETLIRRQPDSGAAELMWTQLLAVAASEELNLWRDKAQQVLRNEQKSGVITASGQSSDNPPVSPFQAGFEQPASALLDRQASMASSIDQAAVTPEISKVGSPLNIDLMNWICQQIPLRHPSILGEPDMLLQMSSWFHRYSMQSPLVADVQSGVRRIAEQPYMEAYQRASQLESHLWNSAAGPLGSDLNGANQAAAIWRSGHDSHLAAYATNQRPLLDGVADDVCWQSAKALQLRSPEVVGYVAQTEVRMAFDHEWLFVWVQCARDPAAVRPEPVSRREHDSNLSGAERIRIVIDTDRDRMTAFQFEIDQRGLTRESCWGLSQWNPKWFLAQNHTESTWSSELAIPLSEIAADPQILGAHWCVGIERIQNEKTVSFWPGKSGESLGLIDCGLLQFIEAPAAQLPARQ